ncbi:hypothetical protein V866_008404 [Kwoniella sp. B9012]
MSSQQQRSNTGSTGSAGTSAFEELMASTRSSRDDGPVANTASNYGIRPASSSTSMSKTLTARTTSGILSDSKSRQHPIAKAQERK